MSTLDPALKKRIAAVTGKRARAVLDFMLKNDNTITTADLEGMGYKHAPRAVRDVREAGIPIVTTRVRRGGKSIGAYVFGKAEDIENHKLQGRQVLSKDLRDTLYAANGGRCDVCAAKFEARYLQIDHRIPYEIAGEAADESETDKFMLLCGTCQRKKSWSCEHCPNWTEKAPEACVGCYWAAPEGYNHVATKTVRRADVVFEDADGIAAYDEIAKEAKKRNVTFVQVLGERLKKK